MIGIHNDCNNDTYKSEDEASRFAESFFRGEEVSKQRNDIDNDCRVSTDKQISNNEAYIANNDDGENFLLSFLSGTVGE